MVRPYVLLSLLRLKRHADDFALLGSDARASDLVEAMDVGERSDRPLEVPSRKF